MTNLVIAVRVGSVDYGAWHKTKGPVLTGLGVRLPRKSLN